MSALASAGKLKLVLLLELPLGDLPALEIEVRLEGGEDASVLVAIVGD